MKKKYNLRIISTWPAENDLCGVAEFGRNLFNGMRDFTAERGSIDVAAVTRQGLIHNYPPVDIEINRYDPNSWKDARLSILKKANEYYDPTAFFLNHDFGIFGDRNGPDTEGRRVLEFASDFSKVGPTFAQLHTIFSEQTVEGSEVHNERIEITRGLAEICDQVIVLTDRGTEILTAPPYNIDREKITKIPHGVRVRDSWQMDRKKMKELYGLDNNWLAISQGLKSPGKGIDVGIRGWGKFVTERLTKKGREKALYLIGGQWHPNLVREDPDIIEMENNKIDAAVKEYNLLMHTIHDESEIKPIDKNKADIIMFDSKLGENLYRNLDCAANVITILNTNKQQISSGRLADAMWRAIISTKFPHSLDTLVPHCEYKQGLMTDQYSGGVLIDPNNHEQLCDAFTYVAENDARRYKMEDRNTIAAINWEWNTVAKQYITMFQSHGMKRAREKGRGVSLVEFIIEKNPKPLQ